MTERRRNFFILLFVAGLAIASIVIATQKDPRKGLDLQGGVELVQAMIGALLRVKPDSDHAADALAVALCHVQRAPLAAALKAVAR